MNDFGQLEDVNMEIKQYKIQMRKLEFKIKELETERSHIKNRLLNVCQHDWILESKSYGCDRSTWHCNKCQNYK